MPSKPSKPKCTFTKADGSPCKANALPGSDHCYFHDPAREGERKQARHKGGKARSKQAAVLAAPTLKKIKSNASVIKLLSETVSQVQTGAIDVKVANAIGYLASVLVRVLEKADFEKRLAGLEEREKEREKRRR